MRKEESITHKRQMIEMLEFSEAPNDDKAVSAYNSRNIALISFAAFIWSIFFSIQGQYLNDFVADLNTYTPLKISLMVSLIALTGAIVSIVFGSISDNLRFKFGRRKIFILTGGASSALIFFLIPLNNAIAYIIAFNVLMSILNSIGFVCNNSFIPDITKQRKLGKINSLATLGTSLGTVAGFALMIIKSSSVVFFVSGAICSLGFLIVGLFLQEPKIESKPNKWYLEIKDTFQLKRIKSEKSFFNFLISHFLLHMGINVYLPFLLIFLTQQNDPLSNQPIGMGLSNEKGEILIIFAVMTIVSLLASIPFGTIIDKFDTSLFLIISRCGFAITSGLMALTPLLRNLNPLVVGILFIIPYSITNTADIISRGALMHSLVPKEKRGQFLGFTIFAKIIAQIPGVIIGGLLSQFLIRGYQFTFVIGGIILLLSIPFLTFVRNQTNNINTSKAPSIA